MWRSVRLKASVLTISCLLIVYIAKNGDIIKTRLRHPGQFLVKMRNAPRIITEQPDLLQNEAKSDESEMCPKKPPAKVNLGDTLPVHATHEAHELNDTPAPGGHFKPNKCVSRTKTAIIVPYRRRVRHLAVFLNHMFPFLVRQQAEFTIFVIELMPKVAFNRALLLNAGYMEAVRTGNFTCIILHDVDLLPESDSNLYRCGNHPRHMAVALSAFGYKLPYHLNAGGVIAMRPETYRAVNGHSNLYFGWGGEDDDLLFRHAYSGYTVSRYPASVSRYTSIFHERDSGNEAGDLRNQLLWTAEKRMFEDGLNSLKYRRVAYEKLPLYTRVLVDVDRADYEDAIKKYT